MQTALERNHDSRGVDSADARLAQSEGRWESAGSILADRLSAMAEVVMILERLEGDRTTIFVVLRDDPEPVLDAVFAAEGELLRSCDLPFDLRVMKPHDPSDLQSLRATSIQRFIRPS